MCVKTLTAHCPMLLLFFVVGSNQLHGEKKKPPVGIEFCKQNNVTGEAAFKTGVEQEVLLNRHSK